MRVGPAALCSPALCSTAMAVCTLLFSSNALAERVLLVRPPAPDEVLSEAFSRLRAELALQGFETFVLELDPSQSSPSRLSELARERGAFAGISLTRLSGATAAEVCIADRVTGKTSLRTLALTQEADAPSVLAVRASDLLRSSLREFEPTERPPPDVVGVDEKPTPEAVQSWVREPRARFRLEARAVALGVTQEMGPGYGPGLAFGYRALDGLWISVLAVGPAVGASHEGEAGTAKVDQMLALGRLSVVVLGTERFELRPALAAGIYHLNAQGEVEPPLVAQSDQVTSFAGGAGLEADLRLTSAVSLGAEVNALLLTPRPAVAVLGDEYVFPWPFVMASVGVSVEF